MDLKTLAVKLGVNIGRAKDKLNIYKALRYYFIRTGCNSEKNKFQSPSINPTTDTQRSIFQNEKEYSVYQRADYTPIIDESSFNSLYQKLDTKSPYTLFFNSGMAAVSIIMFFLKNTKRLGRIYIGKNVYFETKWLSENYPDTVFFNEYNPEISKDAEIIWLEYPINCTRPSKYPFNQPLDIKSILKNVVALCTKKKSKKIALVIDYTLYYLPIDLTRLIKKVPDNLSVYLITSLQKHRGYGLDLTNGGVITLYSTKKEYEYLKKLRAIMGVSITQETIWTMPPVKAEVINNLVKDSGNNALSIYRKISEEDYGPVKFYFSENSDFLTSFIYIEVDKTLMNKSVDKPYFSDILIAEIIKSARRNKAIMIHGTSFGLPFTRIFKNSERYDNTNSLRIAVGYDKDMNNKVSKALSQGIKSFLLKVL